MDAREVLRKKRDGGTLEASEIEAFLGDYCADRIPDYQASALLMAIFVHGMGEDELFHWTRAMLESGAVLDLAGVDGPKGDKHSTGGVGDKVSLPLAPALAALGVRVPMISGRGLGHTAGTLDKLEAIPGFRVDLATGEIPRLLERTGLAFAAQTSELVPADRKLYALRDATGLVESIPLIASSILSKKLAEDVDGLVLDVKFGSGAFLREAERGARLAETMLSLARRFDLEARAVQSSMAQPLGRAVGHALEVRESLDCLRGEGPADLRALVVALGGELLAALGLAADAGDGAERIAGALDDGSALERLKAVVEAQDGDPRALEDAGALERAPGVEIVAAGRAGHVSFDDCRAIGLAAAALGGARRAPGEPLDHAVGVICLRKWGDEVRAGDPLAELHHRNGRGLARARELAEAAFRVGEPRAAPPLVARRLGR